MAFTKPQIVILCSVILVIGSYSAEIDHKKVQNSTSIRNNTPSSIDSRFFGLGGILQNLFRPGSNSQRGQNGSPFNHGPSQSYPIMGGGNFNQYPNQRLYPIQAQYPSNQYPNQEVYPNNQYPYQQYPPDQGLFYYPQQPQYPNQGINQYPNQGDLNQGPGGFPNQVQGGLPNQVQGGFPNQVQGGFPNQVAFPNEEIGQVNQYPSQGNQYPDQGINQFPSQGNQGINQYPSEGNQFPEQGMNQFPNQYPNQYPDQGQVSGGGTIDGIISEAPIDQPDQGGFQSSNGFDIPSDSANEQLIEPGADPAAIPGIPVVVPPTTTPAGQILFNNRTESASQRQCVQDCPTTTEYNPICGSNNVTYFNPGRFKCARDCGINVFVVRRGACN